MTSGIAVGTHPKRTDGYQALAFQPIIRHPGSCRQGLRQVPVAFAANRRQNRLTLTRPQCQKITDLGAHPAPLFPVAHTDAPSDPRIDFRYGSVVIRDAEIVHSGRPCPSPCGHLGVCESAFLPIRHPASDITHEPVEPIGHRDTPASSGEFPDVMLEVGEGLVGPSQFRSSKGKPQELTVIGLDPSAPNTRKATRFAPVGRGVDRPGGVGEPWHAWRHLVRDPGGAGIGLGGVVAQGPHGETQEGTAVMHDSCSRLSGSAGPSCCGAVNQRLKSVVRQIRTLRSVGAGGG